MFHFSNLFVRAGSNWLTPSHEDMGAQRYALSFPVIATLFGVSASFVKRMSAAGTDLSDVKAVRAYIRNHARSGTQAAVEKSEYYTDVFAALSGTRREYIEHMSEAGCDFRDPAQVRSYLASKCQRQAPPAGKPSLTPAPPASPTLPRLPEPTVVPPIIHKTRQPKAKTPEEIRAILDARREQFEAHPEQAKKWPPAKLREWLTGTDL